MNTAHVVPTTNLAGPLLCIQARSSRAGGPLALAPEVLDLTKVVAQCLLVADFVAKVIEGSIAE